LSTPPLVRLTFFEKGFVWRCVGLCERTGSAFLLILHSSLHVGIAVLAAILSGRSPLIGQRRVGRHGRHPWVLKFRTMWDRRQPFRPRAFVRAEYIDDCLGPELKIPDHVRIIESTIGISVPERWRLDHDRYAAPFEIWLKDAANRWFPPVKAKVDAHQLVTGAVSC
jgi:hypothetical protein